MILNRASQKSDSFGCEVESAEYVDFYFVSTVLDAVQNTEFNMRAERRTIFTKCASFNCHVEYVESC